MAPPPGAGVVLVGVWRAGGGRRRGVVRGGGGSKRAGVIVGVGAGAGCCQMCLEVVVLASISSPSVILTPNLKNESS